MKKKFFLPKGWTKEQFLGAAKQAAGVAITKKLQRGDATHGQWPSPETLALIAASVPKSGNERPDAAVDYAFALWQESCRKLKLAMDIAESYDNAAIAAEIPLPNKFPATRDDFLWLIVGCKTPTDMERFRDFLRYRVERSYVPHKHQGEDEIAWQRRQEQFQKEVEEYGKDNLDRKKKDEVENLMAKYGREGILFEYSWILLAKDYSSWWAGKKSEKARESVQKRKKTY